jgi:hypothetical protein
MRTISAHLLRAPSLAALVLATTGCASIGPKAIPQDRVDYREALSTSWKTQTLSNLVRLRYSDPPIFLDVASIVNSYSLEAGASAGAEFGKDVNGYSLGAFGTYSDRPTISYSPITGDKFTKSVMTPLTPESLLSLVQAGYPVDAVFRLCVKAINGISNQSGSYALRRPADPVFVPLIEALRRIQTSGTVGLRLEKRAAEESAILLVRARGSAELEADRRFIAQTLALKEGDEYRLVFGLLPRDSGEIAILTRSMLEIMTEIGSGIEVPQKDIEENRVPPPPDFGSAPGATLPPLLRVRCSAELPDDAYAAVQYRGQWFWIDDRDMPSKRLFGFLMLLFSLAETGTNPNLPVLTIPTG